MLETFTCATFEPLVGDTFRLLTDAAVPRDLVLREATELPVNSPRAGRAPFSLVFLEPGPTVLPQATYRLEHTGLGPFDLFLVPISADGEGVRYEAVFT